MCAFTASELIPAVWYTVRVAAISAVGQGPFSTFALPVATVPVVPETLPEPPSFILLSTTSVQLLWSVARGVDGGLPILRVIVEQFLTTAGQPQSNQWRPSLLSADASLHAAVDLAGKGQEMKATVLDLLADSSYRFRVSLVNSLGVGKPCAASELVMTTTTVPGIIRRISAVCGTLRSVHVMWQEPEENGGIELVGFQLEQLQESNELGPKPDTVWEPAKCVVHSDVLGIGAAFAPSASESLLYPRPLQPRQDARVIDLMPGSSYRFRVAAVNSRGMGPFSLESEPIRLEATAPMVPRDVRVVTVTSIGCSIEWHVPESCGGHCITLYEVHQCKQRAEITEEVLKKIFNSIDVNSSGALDKSELRTALMKIGKSEAEAGRMLQRIPKNELSFDEFKVHASIAAEAVTFGPWVPCAVVAAHGEDVRPYTVGCNVAVSRFDGGATVVAATVAGLRPGRKYRYRVRCRNSSAVNDGWSEWSSRTTTVMARVSLPSVVPEVWADVLSASAIKLRWLPPLICGGLVVRTYEFALRALDGGNSVRADPLPCEWHAFEPSDYARPELIGSEPVAEGKSDGGGADPEAIIELEEDDITPGSGMELPRRPWLTACAERLEPGVRYEFRVRAVNREGPGEFSNGVCCWTSTSEPLAPSGLRVCDEHPRSCVLAWDSVRCSGGVPLLCYDLEQRALREGEAIIGDAVGGMDYRSRSEDDGSADSAEWTPCIIEPNFVLLTPKQIADLTAQLVAELIHSACCAIDPDMLCAPAVAAETDGLTDSAVTTARSRACAGESPRSTRSQLAARVPLHCSAKVLGLRPGRRCALSAACVLRVEVAWSFCRHTIPRRSHEPAVPRGRMRCNSLSRVRACHMGLGAVPTCCGAATTSV